VRLRFATFLAPRIRPVYELIAAEVGRRLGLETELHTGADFGEFGRGEADAGFVCGLPYVERADVLEPLAAPVLRGERYRGRPTYFSDVVVRRGCGARTFGDLRGRAWAFNDPDSHSGYNLIRARLLRDGEAAGFFGVVQEAGSHEEALRRVVAGEVDGAAIDSQLLAVEMRERPALGERVEVIDSLGPSTIQPVVAARRLPDSLRDELRGALLELGGDPRVAEGLAYGEVERLVVVRDSDYDDIRAMLARSREAGFIALG
jgi:phosphonate transport system substrate-binding protein